MNEPETIPDGSEQGEAGSPDAPEETVHSSVEAKGETPAPPVIVDGDPLVTIAVSLYESGKVSVSGVGLERLHSRRQALVQRELVKAHNTARGAAILEMRRRENG